MAATEPVNKACRVRKEVLDLAMVLQGDNRTTDYPRYKVVKAELNHEGRHLVAASVASPLFLNITVEQEDQFLVPQLHNL